MPVTRWRPVPDDVLDQPHTCRYCGREFPNRVRWAIHEVDGNKDGCRVVPLTGVGKHPGKVAQDLAVGDTVVWNGGTRSTVVAIGRPSPQRLAITFRAAGPEPVRDDVRVSPLTRLYAVPFPKRPQGA